MGSIETDLVAKLRAETSLSEGSCQAIAALTMGVFRLWKADAPSGELGADVPAQVHDLLADGLTELRLYRTTLGEHQGAMWKSVDRVVQRYESALAAEAEAPESTGKVIQE